jgi:hypothetical protein
MLISPSQKIAFIHIQKTEGSTIENILRAQFDDMKTVGTRHSSVKVGIETLDDWNNTSALLLFVIPGTGWFPGTI